MLLTTLNSDGTSNITPISSTWAVGHHLALELDGGRHGLANLRQHGEGVVNVPSPELWERVEGLAPLIGAQPVPNHKQGVFRSDTEKCGVCGLTAARSPIVRPHRITECPVHIEAKLVDHRISGTDTRFALSRSKPFESMPMRRLWPTIHISIREVSVPSSIASATILGWDRSWERRSMRTSECDGEGRPLFSAEVWHAFRDTRPRKRLILERPLPVFHSDKSRRS